MGELLEAIADPANLVRAWPAVRANAGAGGIDGQTIGAFAVDEDHQLASLRRLNPCGWRATHSWTPPSSTGMW